MGRATTLRSSLIAFSLVSALAAPAALAATGPDDEITSSISRLTSPFNDKAKNERIAACVQRNAHDYMWVQFFSGPQGGITIPVTDQKGAFVDQVYVNMRDSNPTRTARSVLSQACTVNSNFALADYRQPFGVAGHVKPLIDNNTIMRRKNLTPHGYGQ